MHLFTFRSNASVVNSLPQRPEILGPVRALEIPRNKMIIVGGAVLDVWGLRRANDIDLVVEDSVLNVLVEDGVKALHRDLHRGHWISQTVVSFAGLGRVERVPSYREYKAIERGPVQMMYAPNDGLYQAPFEEVHAFTDEIDGVLVATREKTLEWKAAVGRPKDLEDVALLERSLEG